MKNKSCLSFVLVGVLVGAGCATHQQTTTIRFNPDGTTNSITIAVRDRTDPILSKVFESDVTGSGVDLDFMGLGNYFSPFKLKFGNFDTTTRTLPTSNSNLFTAPYNVTLHHNASLIQNAGDNNASSTTNLPAQAFIGPNIQTLNPAVQPAAPAAAPATNTNTPTQ